MWGLVVGQCGCRSFQLRWSKNKEAGVGGFMDSEVSRLRREGKTKPGAKLSMNGGG